MEQVDSYKGIKRALGPAWTELLKSEFEKPYLASLVTFITDEYNKKKIYPGPNDVFKAYELTQPENVKVVIIGQDPYHNGHAHGLAFSSLEKTIPVSLRVIFKDICNDQGIASFKEAFPHSNLTSWAKQGVFLLNTILTVESGKAKSHAGKGWEHFTRATIEALWKDDEPKVFLLWGKDAQTTWAYATELYKPKNHLVLHAAHPATAAYGKDMFSGHRHFSTTNAFLMAAGKKPIIWTLENQE